ncbi:MAG TPA: histidine kinase [Ohtaekwangia sp.]|nr:histidine kinase [Ohtaekwangia sp.]
MNRFFRYHLDHILFWVLTAGFHAYTRMHLIGKAGALQLVLEIVLRNALLASVIYFNLLVVIPRIAQGKLFVWLFASVGSLAFYAFAKNLHDVYLYGYVIGDPERLDFFHNTFYNFSIVFFYLAFAGALYLSKQWYVQRELLQQIRLEKLNTELDYLKAQINPHFLFNSLNTIFFQIDKQNLEARETLGKFSDMLRYQLYECNGNAIAIGKELAYLKNFVDLQQLRRNGHDVIEFNVSDDVSDFSLPPMLLIPFIENAFKHVSNFTDRKNEVKIALKRDDNILSLQVINTTSNGTASSPGGIGLKNARRRLELLFPDRHTLAVKKTTDRFEVNLTLELS